jgi:hypothetical protein
VGGEGEDEGEGKNENRNLFLILFMRGMQISIKSKEFQPLYSPSREELARLKFLENLKRKKQEIIDARKAYYEVHKMNWSDYRAKNHDKVAQANREYYKQHREELLAYQKAWRERNRKRMSKVVHVCIKQQIKRTITLPNGHDE